MDYNIVQIVINGLILSCIGGFLTGFVYFGSEIVRFPMKGFWNLVVVAWAFIITFFISTVINFPSAVENSGDWVAGGLTYTIFIGSAAIGTYLRKKLRQGG